MLNAKLIRARLNKIKNIKLEFKEKKINHPFLYEKDRVEFKSHGFNCLMVRNDMGCWCGYVGLPPTHKYYGKSYDELNHITVHGGLTYSGVKT